MKPLMRVIAIFDRAVNLLVLLAAIILIFMMLLIIAEVFMRYFLGRPMLGVIEISEYSLVFITFAVAAWVLKEEGHVKMDLVLNQLNPRAQVWLNLITSSICVFISLTLSWYGMKVIWYHWQIGYLLPTPLRPPSFLLIGIVFIGSFLLSIQFLRRTYGFLRSCRALSKKP